MNIKYLVKGLQDAIEAESKIQKRPFYDPHTQGITGISNGASGTAGMDEAIVGYTGYRGEGGYMGYTGGCYYYGKPKNDDLLGGYKVGQTITIYNEKTAKEQEYIIKKKYPSALAIKKKGWFTFTRIIYRSNVYQYGHLLIEK